MQLKLKALLNYIEHNQVRFVYINEYNNNVDGYKLCGAQRFLPHFLGTEDDGDANAVYIISRNEKIVIIYRYANRRTVSSTLKLNKPSFIVW